MLKENSKPNGSKSALERRIAMGVDSTTGTQIPEECDIEELLDQDDNGAGNPDEE